MNSNLRLNILRRPLAGHLLSILLALGTLAPARATTGLIAPDGVSQTSGNSHSLRPPTELYGDAASTAYLTPFGATNGWHTATGTTATFVFAFTDPRTISHFHLWNYNHGTSWTLGVKNFTLEVSTEATGETFIPAGSFTAKGSANNSTVETFPLAASGVRRVRWTITSNHGYSNLLGASEIAFTGDIPPPAFPSLGQGWELPPAKGNFHIFLLMGQSNMAGYGDLVAGDTDPVPGIVVLDGQSVPSTAEPSNPMVWRKGSHRLHVLQTTGRFGLGMDFAKQYLADHPGVLVGLIPCAWGGAEINSLNKGTGSYTNAINRAAYASIHGTIKGVLWHQGESDSVTSSLANAYQAKLHQLIKDLRADTQCPDLPFIAGELAHFYYPNRPATQQPNILIVQHTLNALPTFDGRVACVKMDGLSSYGDNVHFNRSSYITMGQRYAAALLAIQKRNHAETKLAPSAANGHKLEWSPSLDKTFTVEYNPDLAPANWTVLATGRSSGFIDTHAAHLTAPRGFYRLVPEN